MLLAAMQEEVGARLGLRKEVSGSLLGNWLTGHLVAGMESPLGRGSCSNRPAEQVLVRHCKVNCIKVSTTHLNCHLSSVQPWFRLPPAHALLGLVVDVVLLLLQPERLRLRDASPSGQVCGGAETRLENKKL